MPALDHAQLGRSSVFQPRMDVFHYFWSVLWKTSKRAIRDGVEFNRRGFRLIGQEGTWQSRREWTNAALISLGWILRLFTPPDLHSEGY